MIKNFLDADEQPAQPAPAPTGNNSRKDIVGLFDDPSGSESQHGGQEPYVLSTTEPESQEESVRNIGLAWSMGVVFFSAVVFMLIIGWGADLLFGSSPWGIVGGIIIGALIGFIQLFRLSSQMFRK